MPAKNYFRNQLNQADNARKTWKIINTLLNRNKKATIDSMSINGTICSDGSVIADEFNKYFINVASELAQNIQSPDANFVDFLGNPAYTLFQFEPATETEVENIVLKLKNSAPGYDNSSPFIFKHVIFCGINFPLFAVNPAFGERSPTNQIEISCDRFGCCVRSDHIELST